MNASILSKDQQKRVISVKKKGPSKGLRNVLAQPFNNYWPVLNNEQVGPFEQILKKSLSFLHQPKKSIPWTQLRKMSREERLAIKKSKLENKEISPLSLLFVSGINAVTRGLEKKCLSSVLLDSHVEPILIKHIVIMCENDNIPIILVPGLKIISLETIGFKTAAFAIKSEAQKSKNENLSCLHKKIFELSSEFEQLKLSNPLPLEVISTCEKTAGEISADFPKKIDTPVTVLTNIYLHRSSNEERVFIPEEENKDCSLSFNKWTDYIPLGNDEDSEPKKLCNKRYTTSNAVYIPVKMKRMQGNNNRIKATKAQN
ncbi:uncharacterized protein LOC127285322 [Leptopilina boulardi]|uniref:uncharacterized protein LOC127285322 n=1 Tax=Leptopilina boulardi TaxID=63433 RepID=UPI0021F5C1C4|nr:uncharacterized protein LOC127285322 [Leptopilina boulardi]